MYKPLIKYVSDFALLLLHQVATTKGNEKIAEWSDGIINHFWYCGSAASECDNEVKATAVLEVKCVDGEHNSYSSYFWSYFISMNIYNPGDVINRRYNLTFYY